jgi:hypothetical protein
MLSCYPPVTRFQLEMRGKDQNTLRMRISFGNRRPAADLGGRYTFNRHSHG